MNTGAYPFGLSVFFPARNEASNIEHAVMEAEAVLHGLFRKDDYEIIIVDDGSIDGTGEIAESIAARESRVRVIHHSENLGYGAALKTGILAAQKEFVFWSDADMQFDMRDLKKLLPYAESRNAVLGFRESRKDPFIRKIYARGWNILNRILFDLSVRDIDCAFKLFRRETLLSIPVYSNGAMASAEILMRLKRNGVSFAEVPVGHRERAAGRASGAKPSVVFRAFREMMQIYWGDHERGGNDAASQAMRFASVGLLNTAVDFFSYVYMTRLIPFFAARIILAKIVSFGFGTATSLKFNHSWTFGMKGKLTLAEAARFYSVAGISLVVNAISMYVFADLLHLNDIIAAGLSTVATFSWSFIASRLWVFTGTSAHPRRLALEQ
ncbi:MAG TPA: bifunctional glycosyltransferase family 2/GtrA family protein [Candidatus Paceibacterota bacterium]|jgi:glycosyltransferase involved in cell wall biosynthesis|nr:bifunctional glycosyltransferase family 2/GtrA family protein [Candidatus Paceibacterota bacterium]